MRAPLLVVLLSLTAAAQSAPRFLRFTSRMEPGRNTRGLLASNLALFEAFPANGAGTSGACSTTPPTGAKGEALTFTRASNGTCTKTATGGLATAGIADGDLVVLSSNQPRVEYDSAGTLGLLVESSRTNVNLQSANLANGIYSNVGTPTVTANTTVSPDGTTTMATIQDTSGAALEGRSQTVTVTAGQPYTLSVFVKAGTLSAVTVSLDGTTATCTGLSATTSTRCIVTDASASGAAIVASVTAGTVVSDTGSFAAWGQQVEQGNYASSYIPTGASSATRVAETPTFSLSGIDPSVSGCMMASVDYANGSRWEGTNQDAAALSLTTAANVTGSMVYMPNWTQFAAFSGGQVATQTVDWTGVRRIGASWTGTAVDSIFNGTRLGGTWTAPLSTRTTLQLGSFNSSRCINTIITRIQYDSAPTRCQ